MDRDVYRNMQNNSNRQELTIKEEGVCFLLCTFFSLHFSEIAQIKRYDTHHYRGIILSSEISIRAIYGEKLLISEQICDID